MTKAAEKKLIKKIKDLVGAELVETDSILIQELVDWLKITEHTKDNMQEAVKTGDKLGWQDLTTLSLATKQVLAISKALGITVYERKKTKKKEKDVSNGFDLQKFLKG